MSQVFLMICQIIYQLIDVKSQIRIGCEVKTTRITSAAITAANLNVSYMFGQPRTAKPGGLSIDVDRDLSTVKSVTGNAEKEKAYNQLSGVVSSYLEGDIFE